ncbi:ABC transporter substrate-binding protein [Streptoalloteichus hindustanus]|uniref:ABC transporter substrate-binding protein n=1 Tax=Streptoalloteichus hindustanus TaxID=2017 RepID=UPI00135646DC|nr:ABC transporter substrate-binding protein [Streptoalloteichus hindustanus]
MLGGSTNTGPGAAGDRGLERDKVVVGALPVADVAPLHLARERGYFSAAGLEVEIRPVPSGPEAVTLLLGGGIDIAFSTYPPFYTATAKGTGKLRIVAEALAAKAGTAVLMAAPNSPVRQPGDLTGRKVAVTSTGSISDVSVMAAARMHGVDPASISFVPMPFPNMETAMQQGSVDAALLAEPFVTKASKNIGAREVFDTATGPTAGLPLSGYGARADFVDRNPKVVAAFQRALARAQAEAEADRSLVEAQLQKFAGIDGETARLMKLGSYPTSLEPSRLQRVPNLLFEFGVLKQQVEAKDLIVQPR